MKILKYKIKKQHLINLNEYIFNPVQYSLNYLYLMFNFDEEWEELNKYILFKSKGKSYLYFLENYDEEENYIIKVPNFLLKTNGFQITLYGKKDDLRITTNTKQIYIDESDFTTHISPVEPEPEPKDIINYILTELKNKVNIEQGKGLSEEDFTTILKDKLDNIEDYANHTIIDNNINNESENPVQNKTINGALNLKADEIEFDVLLTQMTEKIREL